jgi:tRNA1(Val) A37 N6-methylase TrmN6
MDIQAVTARSASGASEDDFLGGALRLRQPPTGYRAGVDAVLLAATVPASTGRAVRILDVGAGVGTVGLCVARRLTDARVVLVEREDSFAELAQSNIDLNGLSDRVSLVTADITGRAEDLDAVGLTAHLFDHVLANPPYHDVAGGTLAADRTKAGAHAMAAGDLDRWARFLARMTRDGGSATIIHKAEALGAILAVFARRFGDILVLPIQARPTGPAIRIIVQGVRGSRAPLTLLPAFVLHGGEGHGFTAQAAAVLRHSQAMPLRPAPRT